MRFVFLVLAGLLLAPLGSALDLPMADGTVLRNAEVKSVVDGSVCLTVKAVAGIDTAGLAADSAPTQESRARRREALR